MKCKAYSYSNIKNLHQKNIQIFPKISAEKMKRHDGTGAQRHRGTEV
jgi:hypothetical protein